jgi:hypothetical protein
MGDEDEGNKKSRSNKPEDDPENNNEPASSAAESIDSMGAPLADSKRYLSPNFIVKVDKHGRLNRDEVLGCKKKYELECRVAFQLKRYIRWLQGKKTSQKFQGVFSVCVQ